MRTLDHLNRCLVLKQLAETVVEQVYFAPQSMVYESFTTSLVQSMVSTPKRNQRAM